MTKDEKLAAILAAVQTDPVNRGLGKVPGNNLFTACAGDFVAACRSIAEHPAAGLQVYTGFYIPTLDAGGFETDGPLGAVFLARAFGPLGLPGIALAEVPCGKAIRFGFYAAGVIPRPEKEQEIPPDANLWGTYWSGGKSFEEFKGTHLLAIERVGPAADGRCYTMRGADVGVFMRRVHGPFVAQPRTMTTIGIGDGGNEIGMGKIPHETIIANIPNGDLIHCRVPTDHLIVAGLSNWGAYALAAGVYVLKGEKPHDDLFKPDRERDILEAMVRDGLLVDGVTGQQTATVDGLSWEEYAKPMIRIREILRTP